MFVTKLKGVLAVVVVAGPFLAGAAGLFQARAAGQPAKEGQPAANKGNRKGAVKPDSEAAMLVRQLGSEAYAEREAAEKALVKMGARAAASARAGRADADLEIARR